MIGKQIKRRRGRRKEKNKGKGKERAIVTDVDERQTMFYTEIICTADFPYKNDLVLMVKKFLMAYFPVKPKI